MKWTSEKLKTARDILETRRDIGVAMTDVRLVLGKSISLDALRRAFSRNGWGSPISYLEQKKPHPSLSFSTWTPDMVNAFNTMDPSKMLKEIKAGMGSGKVIVPQATSRIIVISDLHAPYHDKAAWECLLQVIRETKPATVVIIGDFADMYAISSHPKSLDRKRDFANELAGVNAVLDELRKAAGDDCRIVWTEGNHEDRITRYLQSSAPELGGIKELRAEGLFKCKERNIEWVPYRRSIKIGNCSFTHDVGRCGVNTARQSLMDFGGNLVIGHSHRGGLAYQGEVKGSSHFCLNVGWLGDVNEIDYIHRNRAMRDWQLGFGVVDQDENGFSWAQFIPVLDGACVVDGKIIRGNITKAQEAA